MKHCNQLNWKNIRKKETQKHVTCVKCEIFRALGNITALGKHTDIDVQETLLIVAVHDRLSSLSLKLLVQIKSLVTVSY